MRLLVPTVDTRAMVCADSYNAPCETRSQKEAFLRTLPVTSPVSILFYRIRCAGHAGSAFTGAFPANSSIRLLRVRRCGGIDGRHLLGLCHFVRPLSRESEGDYTRSRIPTRVARSFEFALDGVD
jgi:hypothetical protein